MHYSALLTSASFAVTALAACSRESLEALTKAYVEAQSSGEATGFTQLTVGNISYSENEVPMDISAGVLTQAVPLDHNRSIHDTTACSAFTELIAASAPHQYVIGTRLLATEDGSKVHTMESIVTDAGDWAFNATGYLYWNSLETWEPIPEDQRDSREVIQAAGDAYFNRFDDVNVTVPFGTPCARLEGGAYTGARNLSIDSCTAAGMPSGLVVTNRRYVIDETMGTVDIFLGFPGLDRSQGQDPMPDSHLFRVEGGKIRYIHTVSSCVEAGCGLGNFTFPPPPQRRRVKFHGPRLA